MFNSEASNNLAQVSQIVPNSVQRIAKTGTPMLVIQGKKDTFALYYFCKSRNYRLFWPWPSHDQKQHQKNFKTPFEVRNYLMNKES